MICSSVIEAGTMAISTGRALPLARVAKAVREILEAVGEGRGPAEILVSLGYAGWAPGQIEQELGQNAWLTVPAQADLIFHLPAEERFSAAMDLLGVDLARLSDDVGHA